MTKRAEHFLLIIFGVLFAVSFFTKPLFPVQRYPLFADAPTQYESYRAYTPDNEVIPLPVLRLQNTYDGDPTFYVGRLPQTIYQWGKSLTTEDLQKNFSELQPQLSQYPVICLERSLWGLQTEGHFGITRLEILQWEKGTLQVNPLPAQSKCGGVL